MHTGCNRSYPGCNRMYPGADGGGLQDDPAVRRRHGGGAAAAAAAFAAGGRRGGTVKVFPWHSALILLRARNRGYYVAITWEVHVTRYVSHVIGT